MPDLYLPFSFRGAGWWRAHLRLERALSQDAPDTASVRSAWARLARALVAAGAGSMAEAVAAGLVTGRPPWEGPRTGARADELPGGLAELLRHDLATLSAATRVTAEPNRSGTTAGLPALRDLAAPHPDGGLRALAEALDGGDAEALMALYLGELSARGGGPSSLHPALTWDGGALRPVAAPDIADWEELFGLDSQLERLAANTEALLAGTPAHDALLYGARGSGKSTAVRGLLKRFAGTALRLVEVRSGALGDLPDLLERLRHRPQAFVLYVDDLSFDGDDPAYRPLKSLLEGGLASRPRNVAVYATSNRRHLLAERFSDRPSPEDEDVSRWDTQHEKLALADRFGLVITFPDATQRRYLELVRGLAQLHGVADEVGEEAALRFAEWGNGYSGRTARQFVDSLRQARPPVSGRTSA